MTTCPRPFAVRALLVLVPANLPGSDPPLPGRGGPAVCEDARHPRATHAGELYERCANALANDHTTHKLHTAEWLRDDDAWVSLTLAQQAVSRLLERQGQASS